MPKPPSKQAAVPVRATRAQAKDKVPPAPSAAPPPPPPSPSPKPAVPMRGRAGAASSAPQGRVVPKDLETLYDAAKTAAAAHADVLHPLLKLHPAGDKSTGLTATQLENYNNAYEQLKNQTLKDHRDSLILVHDKARGRFYALVPLLGEATDMKGSKRSDMVVGFRQIAFPKAAELSFIARRAESDAIDFEWDKSASTEVAGVERIALSSPLALWYAATLQSSRTCSGVTAQYLYNKKEEPVPGRTDEKKDILEPKGEGRYAWRLRADTFAALRDSLWVLVKRVPKDTASRFHQAPAAPRIEDKRKPDDGWTLTNKLAGADSRNAARIKMADDNWAKDVTEDAKTFAADKKAILDADATHTYVVQAFLCGKEEEGVSAPPAVTSKAQEDQQAQHEWRPVSTDYVEIVCSEKPGAGAILIEAFKSVKSTESKGTRPIELSALEAPAFSYIPLGFRFRATCAKAAIDVPTDRFPVLRTATQTYAAASIRDASDSDRMTMEVDHIRKVRDFRASLLQNDSLAEPNPSCRTSDASQSAIDFATKLTTAQNEYETLKSYKKEMAAATAAADKDPSNADKAHKKVRAERIFKIQQQKTSSSVAIVAAYDAAKDRVTKSRFELAQQAGEVCGNDEGYRMFICPSDFETGKGSAAHAFPTKYGAMVFPWAFPVVMNPTVVNRDIASRGFEWNDEWDRTDLPVAALPASASAAKVTAARVSASAAASAAGAAKVSATVAAKVSAPAADDAEAFQGPRQTRAAAAAEASKALRKTRFSAAAAATDSRAAGGRGRALAGVESRSRSPNVRPKRKRNTSP